MDLSIGAGSYLLNSTTLKTVIHVVSQGYLRDVLGINAASLQMTHAGMVI